MYVSTGYLEFEDISRLVDTLPRQELNDFEQETIEHLNYEVGLSNIYAEDEELIKDILKDDGLVADEVTIYYETFDMGVGALVVIDYNNHCMIIDGSFHTLNWEYDEGMEIMDLKKVTKDDFDKEYQIRESKKSKLYEQKLIEDKKRREESVKRMKEWTDKQDKKEEEQKKEFERKIKEFPILEGIYYNKKLSKYDKKILQKMERLGVNDVEFDSRFYNSVNVKIKTNHRRTAYKGYIDLDHKVYRTKSKDKEMNGSMNTVLGFCIDDAPLRTVKELAIERHERQQEANRSIMRMLDQFR